MNSGATGAPRVAILLATHNGRRFLGAQLDSILLQDGVDLVVYASDDGSTDGTLEYLQHRAGKEHRLVILPTRTGGSAHRNFLRLIRDLDTSGFDAVGFADQDDIWRPGRLRRQMALIDEGYAAVSSNVEAFDDAGHRWLVEKDQPLQTFDWLFESGGPGSTFLISADWFRLIQACARDPLAEAVDAHDWFAYAVIRAAGGRWRILHDPLVDYRQHDGNVLGANRGVLAAWSRARTIARGSYRRRVSVVGALALPIATDAMQTPLRTIVARLDGGGSARRSLARHVRHFRRKRSDATILAIVMHLGLW